MCGVSFASENHKIGYNGLYLQGDFKNGCKKIQSMQNELTNTIGYQSQIKE